MKFRGEVPNLAAVSNLLSHPSLFPILVLLVLAWGGLAFGAVYPWAYWPLLGSTVILGFWALFVSRRQEASVTASQLGMGLALLVAAVCIQLLPLSQQTLVSISPAADALLLRYDVAYAASAVDGQPVRHALSIHPSRTLLGLVFLVCLGLFLLGLVRKLDGIDVRTLTLGIGVIGAVLALVGLIQQPLFNGKIYGFWEPVAGPLRFTPGGGPYGPFVNRNHFAGWMVMALPLVMSYFCATVTRPTQASQSLRDRVLWFSSPIGNRAMLLGFSIVLMSTALVSTFSRSGITCFAVAVGITGIAVARNNTGAKRPGLLVFLGFMVFAAFAWTGFDGTVSRFELANAHLPGRLLAWRDAIQVYTLFPWTGTGLNTYGAAMLFLQTHRVSSVHYAEAHSDYLQLLAEGGLLLLIPAAVLAATVVRQVRMRFQERLDDHTGYWLRMGAVTGMVGIALQEIIEFSLQMPGNAALFIVLCSIAVRKGNQRALRSGASTASA